MTIHAAVDNLWQALNDTPTSTPTAFQLQHGCLPLTAHQFLSLSGVLMIVKSNQPTLFARIQAFPWAEVLVTATDDDHGHGRIERRTLQILTAARGIGFPYAKQVVRITRERLVSATGARTVEVVYAICSLPFEQAPGPR